VAVKYKSSFFTMIAANTFNIGLGQINRCVNIAVLGLRVKRIVYSTNCANDKNFWLRTLLK
jgi:hypothetical protein